MQGPPMQHSFNEPRWSRALLCQERKFWPHGGRLSQGHSASITSKYSAFKHHMVEPATE